MHFGLTRTEGPQSFWRGHRPPPRIISSQIGCEKGEFNVMIKGYEVIKFDFERRDGTEFSRWYAYAPGKEQPEHKAPTLPELMEQL
jgi:hypothetical protein